MFDSAILDVVIGLAFVYLMLSLVCTTVNETLAALLQSRARNLEHGLKELLQDPDAARGGLVESLYQHPIIDGLYRGDYGDGGRKATLPSYIPSRSFALAMLDLIQPGQAQPGQGAAPSGTEAVATLRASLASSPLFLANPELSRTLAALIDSAGGDMARVRANIERWYDSSMDSVSGWYKRRTQYVVLALGLGLAVVANADTFAMGDSLVRSKALREALVKGSQDYENLAMAQPGRVGAAPPSPPARWLETKLAGLRPLRMPIGWEAEDLARPSYWLGALPGWLITGFAISLGAPFWFDVLNRFMVIRSTVKPHEKSAEQGPRD